MFRGRIRPRSFAATRGLTHAACLLPITFCAGAPPAVAAAPPPQLPAPTYQSVSVETLIPMDDGVRLSATITFPSQDGKTPAPGRFPVVLQMTPYGRSGVCGCFAGTDFATRGMISAIVDVRGTGGSEGTLKDNYFSPREQRDGYDLVEYFGTQPYSSGRVGMAGGSYLGIDQYFTAEQQPPHLTVITPVSALSDLYREGYTHEGIPNFFFDAQYLGVQQPASLSGFNSDASLFSETINAKIQQVPGSAGIAFDYLERPDDGPFYQDRSPLYHADRITVPALIYDGWHDGFIFGANEMYRVLSRRPGVETRLYVDPCTHKGCGPPFDPETNPSNLEGAGGDSRAVFFEFLRKYLVPGASEPQRPAVRFYVQGSNQWMDSTQWPPPSAKLQPLFLAPSALERASPTPPSTQSYFTDPAAGLSMSFDQYGTVAASPYIPLDQRAEEEAGLTWRTPPLTQPLTLTGDGVLHLVAASTASDTDWFAKLADVAADGSESIITAGFLRASHRALDLARSTPDRPWHTNINPTPIQPGKFYDYDLAIWPTGYELAPGHRLQLRLTSYDFPTHFPGTFRAGPDNPAATSFTPLPPATNTVQLGGPDPSYMRLFALGSVASAGQSSRSAATLPGACVDRRRFMFRLHHPRHERITRVSVFVNGRLARTVHGHRLTHLTLRRLPLGTFTVTIITRTNRGTRATSTRTYYGCNKTPPRHHFTRGRRPHGRRRGRPRHG
ncbi:MAG TPA: CocE/NonD family hydrolase [Solirubrobacteraceae bacterium]|nr:CocE/NonD family hydrolase [Solirubrobacteraceae bacterium]